MKNNKSLVGKFSGLSKEQQSSFLAQLKKKEFQQEPSQKCVVARVSQAQLAKGIALSYSQQRLWFIDKLEGADKASYNMPVAVGLKGKVNVASIQRALQAIVDRHDVLRSRIVVQNGEPRQVIDPLLELNLEVTAVTEVQLQTALCDFASQPFELEKGKLFKAEMFQVNDENHVLCLNMHHIVSDGWSLEVIKKEFIHHYRSGTPLPALEAQFHDFAHWQRQPEQDEAIKSGLTFWARSLAGLPDYLPLPTCNERPIVLAEQGTIYCDSLALEARDQIELFSRSHQVSTFVTLMSVFNVLLNRYTNTCDIAVGTPVANRQHKSIESNIGLFVNTLVVRNQVDPSLSFATLLQNVNGVIRSAFEHQNTPFEKVVEHLKPNRSQSYTPLFQVMLVYQDFPSAVALELDGLTMTEIPISSATSKFDLTLFVQRERSGFNLRLEYNTTLFDENFIAQFTNHYKQLAIKLCSEPELKIGAVPLQTDHENKLIAQWQGKRCDRYQKHSLVSLIHEQVKCRPNATAVKIGTESITFEQLYRDALQISKQLNDAQLATNAIVAIAISSDWRQISAVLGALISGITFVPIDVSLPTRRQQQILSLSGASMMLVEKTIECLSITQVLVKKVNDSADIGFDVAAKVNDLACIVFDADEYDSEPKGIQISQSSIINSILDVNAQLPLTHEDSILAVSEFDCEYSIFERFSILACGGCVTMLHQSDLESPKAWAAALSDHDISTWHSSPYKVAVLLAYFQSSNTTLPTALNKLCLVAQHLDQKLVARIEAWNDQLLIYGFEGLPEAASWSLLRCYGKKEQTNKLNVLSNQKVHILNSALETCPQLVNGAVYRSGCGVADAYWNKAAPIDTRFVVHPRTGERLFKSGELGRRLASGELEINQYDQHKVIINGRPTSLVEVKSVLDTHRYVSASKVDVVRGRSGGDVLVATVATGAALTKSELYRYLRNLLPHYMVPRYYNIGSEIKADPIEYTEQLLAGFQVNSQFVVARTPLEEDVNRIWCKVLGDEQISINDRFTELGGTSMQAIKIVNEVNAAFEIKITLKEFFRCESIAALARLLSRAA
ncbi:non-ribosomal peptide synthetase [Pseudoalteromonas luteoviolacea]|uniref:non-ribosomal peptide synthetase n=1 Tax=Pseudoalteromonas luteoviolacea TaxID=43657 RepID=UPI001B380A61|nr:condensation domain-containing protein [Pseudoalteromonas luteoviolacea]MBQ4835994.1 AMP-binding protein [Pseudoalteromonas luteoviolacea]